MNWFTRLFSRKPQVEGPQEAVDWTLVRSVVRVENPGRTFIDFGDDDFIRFETTAARHAELVNEFKYYLARRDTANFPDLLR